MTIAEIKKTYPLHANEIIDIVRKEVDRHNTSWSTVKLTWNRVDAGHTQSGYRKNTTGEYVANAYRNNFGWKNTYYEHAVTRVFVPVDFRG